jgi:predicted glycosyltransferase
LLDNFRIPYTVLSRIGRGRFALLKELVVRDLRLLRFCRKFKPDVLTGIGGIFAAHAGFLLRKPVVVWDDTEHAKFSHLITFPFAKIICSPDCYKKSYGVKHRKYAGYHELAYLHPNRFKPDMEIVKGLGLDPAEKYCIVRFVSWAAHHDVGQHGFSGDERLKFVKKLSEYAKVFITSEAPLPVELVEFGLKIPPHLIHHVLAFARLCVSEGATIASECAVLGTPAVYINTLKAGTIDEQERYGLLRQTTRADQALEMSLKYLQDEEAVEQCRTGRARMLAEKIDVTDYIVQTIEEIAK